MEENINNNYDRINRYFRGEMTPEEEALFEADLANDETLMRQAEAMARMIKGMETVGCEQDKMMIEKMKASSNRQWIHTVKWLSMAASFALFFAIGYYVYDYSRIGNLGKEYASTFPVTTIVRGEENEDVANKLTVLFDNVAKGEDLGNTIVQLSKLWELSQSDTYNEYTNYAPYIGWNLAIAHLRNHEKNKAKKVLEEMAKDYPEGTAMGDKVIELRGKFYLYNL